MEKRNINILPIKQKSLYSPCDQHVHIVGCPGAQVVGQVLPSVVGCGAGLQFVTVADLVQRQVLRDELCELHRVTALADRGHHQLVVDFVQLVLVWDDFALTEDEIAFFRLPDYTNRNSVALTRLHHHYRAGVRRVGGHHHEIGSLDA